MKVAVSVIAGFELTPVIVIVNEPCAALRLNAIVSVDEPAPVMEVGLKLAVAPEGSPLTLSDTAELNPFNTLVLTV